MIADYLWLSVQLRNNCSFCAYLTGDICPNCPFGMDLQRPLSENQMFFRLQGGRCNYFAMFAFFSLCIASAQGKPYIALFSQTAPEHAKNVHNIFATVKQQRNCPVKNGKIYSVTVTLALNAGSGRIIF